MLTLSTNRTVLTLLLRVCQYRHSRLLRYKDRLAERAEALPTFRRHDLLTGETFLQEHA